MAKAPAPTPTEVLRAEQRAAAVRQAEHDGPKMERALVLLDGMRAAATELGDLAGQILTPYIGDHLTGLKLDVDRAKLAVGTAQLSVAATLAEG